MSRATLRTKPKSTRRTAKQPIKNVAQRKRRVRMLNGIPLKRATIWVYDVDSPQFKAARKRDLKLRKAKNWDRDGMQWAEAVFNDPDWQKWWR